MKIRQLFELTVVVVAVQVMFAQAVVADVLVMRDGGRLETAGPWTIEGPLVVFRLLSGKLSSVRLSAVDETSSGEVMARPSAPREERESEPTVPKPVRVLTNRDIRRAASPPFEGEGVSSGPQASSAGSAVFVDTWAEVERREIDGIEIIGWLKNRSRMAKQVYDVTVDLYDDGGNSVRTVHTLPNKVLVQPGSSTKFRAKFGGVGRDRWRPRFKIESGRARDDFRDQRQQRSPRPAPISSRRR